MTDLPDTCMLLFECVCSDWTVTLILTAWLVSSSWKCVVSNVKISLSRFMYVETCITKHFLRYMWSYGELLIMAISVIFPATTLLWWWCWTLSRALVSKQEVHISIKYMQACYVLYSDFSFLHIHPTAVVTQYFAAFLPARYDGVIKYDAWQYFKQADSKWSSQTKPHLDRLSKWDLHVTHY